MNLPTIKLFFFLILIVLRMSTANAQPFGKEYNGKYDPNDSIAKACKDNPEKCGFLPIKKAQKIAAAAIKNEHLKCKCKPYYTNLHYHDSSKIFYFTFGYWEWLERPMKLKIYIEINAKTGEVIDKQKTTGPEKHPLNNKCFCDKQPVSPLPNTAYPFKEFIQKKNKIIADGITYNYISYYEKTGKIKELGNFKKSGKSEDDKIKHWMYFYENGKLKQEGNYENGLKTGIWKYYYNNGQKEEECHHKIVIKEGIGYYLTRPSGEVPPRRKKIKDKKESEKTNCRYWDKDGTPINAATYHKLKSHALVKYAGQYLTPRIADSLHKALRKHKQDSLKNRIDSIVTFFPNQKMKSIEWWKGGKYPGGKILRKMEWYENGILRYHHDYDKGTNLSYYDNGQKESESVGENYTEWYPNGNKKREILNGVHTRWYENGNKMQEWFYENNLKKERYYWMNGQKMAEGTVSTLKSTYLEGKWSFWNKDGKFIGYGINYRGDGDMCTDGYWVMFSTYDFNNVYKRFYKKCNLISEKIIKQ